MSLAIWLWHKTSDGARVEALQRSLSKRGATIIDDLFDGQWLERAPTVAMLIHAFDRTAMPQTLTERVLNLEKKGAHLLLITGGAIEDGSKTESGREIYSLSRFESAAVLLAPTDSMDRFLSMVRDFRHTSEVVELLRQMRRRCLPTNSISVDAVRQREFQSDPMRWRKLTSRYESELATLSRVHHLATLGELIKWMQSGQGAFDGFARAYEEIDEILRP